MNVYDFDKTIYDGDSTLDFYRYCMRKNPGIILCIPRQMLGALRYTFKLIDKTTFKEEFYCFFRKIDNIDELVDCFWNDHESGIKEWYLSQKETDDLIISASPRFLLENICIRLGISNLIASEVDKCTGKYSGINCYGVEKVKRFQDVFPDGVIHNFYSDSQSDIHLANLAEKSWIVKRNKIERWINGEKKGGDK